MKRAIAFFFMSFLVLGASVVSASDEALLGNVHVAVKADYIEFTDHNIDSIDVNSGIYLGFEGYVRILENLYLGGESGLAHAKSDGEAVTPELTYIPVEVNLKYAIEDQPGFVMDLGAGVSYNFAKLEIEETSYSENDWVAGGQFFVDVMYTWKTMFFGLNGKYQMTQKGKNIEDTNFTNWRAGAQVGVKF